MTLSKEEHDRVLQLDRDTSSDYWEYQWRTSRALQVLSEGSNTTESHEINSIKLTYIYLIFIYLWSSVMEASWPWI